jgi:hypothetical protein
LRLINQVVMSPPGQEDSDNPVLSFVGSQTVVHRPAASVKSQPPLPTRKF